METEEKPFSYQKAMDYVEEIQVYGSVPGLSSIRRLCEKLGNPQEALTFVHIAGTNGKGSVLAFVSTVLKEAGYRTGRYLSPTVLDYRERFQVNGRMISQKDFCRLLREVKLACDELTARGFSHPTPFEVETALAFLYFKEKNCDLVVLETGLGGRMDATNLIQNTAVCVFTSISLDHMKILGNTLSEIAEEKAGILKTGALAVTIRQKPEVMEVLERRCKEAGVLLQVAEPNCVKNRRSSLGKQTFQFPGRTKGGESAGQKNPGRPLLVELSLIGRYQIDNGVLALEVLDALARKGYPVSEKALLKGMKETSWPGRFQLLCQKPVFIADGAHNRDGAARLAESIQFYFTNKRILYIIGTLRDKEQDEIIRATCPYARQILTVPTRGPRGMSAYELACIARSYHNNVTALDSVEEAVELAFLLADRDTVIIAFGSLSYLGELIRVVEDRDKIRSDSHGKQREN